MNNAQKVDFSTDQKTILSWEKNAKKWLFKNVCFVF